MEISPLCIRIDEVKLPRVNLGPERWLYHLIERNSETGVDKGQEHD